MEFDQQKIDAKLRELNGDSQVEGDWFMVEGMHAITKAGVTKDERLMFYPSSGMLVKSFVNKHTGEIKTYLAMAFKKEN